MIKMNKIVKNYIYSLLYQILATALPIITTPYISRVLGAEGIGTYSYVNSICTYFILFSTLGSDLYGKRKIAYIRDNRECSSEVFWNIAIFRISLGAIGLITYWYFYCINDANRVYSIMILYLLANLIDISWFFHGMEEFRVTVVKNIIIKLVGTILIFIVVKNEKQVWLYALCIAGSTFIANLSLWFYVPRYITKIKVSYKQILFMLIPMVSLFLPQVAIELYTVIDKTMLGKLSQNMAEVGYYEQTQKIVKLATMFVASLGSVMLPNISHDYAKNDMGKIQKKIKLSMRFNLIFTTAIGTGIVAVSDNFVGWFYGRGYEKVIILLKIMSVLVPILGSSNVLGVQFLMPTSKQKEYTISVCIGCLINIILNITLIPQYGSIGAAVSTIIAEFSVTISQILFVSKYLNIFNCFKDFGKIGFANLVMYLGIMKTTAILALNSWKLTMLQIVIGISIYFSLMLLLYRKEFKVFCDGLTGGQI